MDDTRLRYHKSSIARGDIQLDSCFESPSKPIELLGAMVSSVGFPRITMSSLDYILLT